MTPDKVGVYGVGLAIKKDRMEWSGWRYACN